MKKLLILIILSLFLISGIECVFPNTIAEVTNSSHGISFDNPSTGPFTTIKCDINGDGFLDFIYTTSTTIYVYFGPFTTFLYAYNSLNGTNGFTILNSKTKIACKDINNDGFDDLMLSQDTNSSNRAILIYGTNQGYPASAFDPISYITSSPGVVGFYVPGEAGTGQMLGSSKCNGDFNGDGIYDFAFGSNIGSVTPSTGTPVTYVLYGLANGKFPTDANGIFDTTTLNGNNGFKINTNTFYLGCGDVNSDGLDDIIINLDQVNVYIFFGTSTPYPNGVFTPTFNGIDSFKIIQSGSSIFTNILNLFGVGDFNGDGLNDLSFSAKKSGGDNVVYVMYGMLSYQPTYIFPTYINGTTGTQFTIIGNSNSLCTENFLRDVNGDGIADLTCSGATYKVWSVFGRLSPFPATNNLVVSTDPNTFFDRCVGFYIPDSIPPYYYGDFNSDSIIDLQVATTSSDAVVMYGTKFFDISSSLDLTIEKVYNQTDYLPYNSTSTQSNGTCPISFFTVTIEDQNSGDTLEFENPNPSLAGIKSNASNTTITVYSIDPKSTVFFSSVLPLIKLKSANSTQNSTISITLGGQTFDILYTAATIPTNTSTTTSSTTTTSTTTTSTTSPLPQSSESVDNNEGKSKSKVGVIVGPIVAGVAVASLLIFGAFFINKKKKAKKPLENQVSMTQIFTGGKIETIDKF
ncbi:tenascin X [Tieghemostelium lacteum]|uniref:Tenascin X n=1 Tax=Tieghemostelium lacteum TaxID=361077 RepID=A0A152AAA9_TIELA|nr:tenascin X [Tieghemostelium lacteum]|eukprot:KYR03162.1 tenascin X [Tieghemostelium lacteum]